MVDNELYKFESGNIIDIKSITSKEKCFRIRVGKYKILIIIIDELVIVTDIGTRGDIYK
ncbi:MAG: hypothetical protein HZB41_05475 [Ignavibacteriae bacterium]|nr:hypothetical protein [Ignavibacteriota bacterium]